MLNELAFKVNFVWNYCNEVSYKAITSYSRWLSEYDLINMAVNTSKDLNLHAKTIQLVCQEYTKKRYQYKRLKLKWRTQKSLGWIPVNRLCLKIKDEAYSTQLCNNCGEKTGPKNDLSVREWTCSICKSINDRDINAAKNILRFGYETLTEAVS